MVKQISRVCQICHGKAVREDPGWWTCTDCGYVWRVGVNPLAAARKQARARASANHGIRRW